MAINLEKETTKKAKIENKIRISGDTKRKFSVLGKDHDVPCPKFMKIENNELPTPIKFDILKEKLTGYDPKEIDYLQEGFAQGFSLGCSSTTNSVSSVNNLKSSNQNPDIVSRYLKNEVENRRMIGPLNQLPFSSFQINPIGLVPKKEKNKFRTIIDLSSPRGSAINDSIPDSEAAVSYCSIAEAIKVILCQGKHVFLAKTDIKDAFRLIPINPKHYKQLCVKWKGKFYFDKCLPMGARSSCRIFERFSTALEYAARKTGVILVHYLDDFLIISLSKAQGKKDLASFIQLCHELGVPLALNKTEGPSQLLCFVGLEIDTVKEILRLPHDKLAKCTLLIENLLQKKKCTLKELQSILGLLNFVCQVIVPGRAFLQRLYGLTVKIVKPHHTIYLSKETKEDLILWKIFLSSHNGVSLYREELFLSPDVKHIFTDASKTLACAAVFGTSWFMLPWPSSWWSNENITLLELIPIVWAIKTWGVTLKNCYVIVHTDNEALSFDLNSQSSKEILVMKLIRQLVLLLLKYNIMFRAKHIYGYKNVLADALSRLKLDKFKSLFPSADPLPTLTECLPHSLID